VFCNNPDYCNLNAVARRYTMALSPNAITATVPQFYYISSDLTRNTFFPSIASRPFSNTTANCSNFYSFGIMDKNNSANGKIAYKMATCASAALRPAPYTSVQSTIITPEGLSIYPNPAQSVIHFSFPAGFTGGEVFVSSSTGQAIVSRKVNGQKMDINTSGIPAGIYHIRILSGKNSLTKKIAIIK
jgi:hypothetical protein